MISDSIIVRFLASGPRGEAVLASWRPSGRLGRIWASPGSLLGRPWAPAGPSWGALGGVLGGSWRLLGPLGRSWAALGRLLGRPGSPWGALGRLLVRPRWLSGRVQPKPEKTTTVQRFCWFLGLLGAPWVGPGRLLGRREPSMAPSWAVLGALGRLVSRAKWLLGAC